MFLPVNSACVFSLKCFKTGYQISGKRSQGLTKKHALRLVMRFTYGLLEIYIINLGLNDLLLSKLNEQCAI